MNEEFIWYASLKKSAINEIMIIKQEIKDKKKKEKYKKLIVDIKNNIVRKNIFYSSYVSTSI
tara:strand:+ start:9605 stop:9790 length:186 start_codon:yes stop_codon:yes gene_type:complete